MYVCDRFEVRGVIVTGSCGVNTVDLEDNAGKLVVGTQPLTVGILSRSIY